MPQLCYAFDRWAALHVAHLSSELRRVEAEHGKQGGSLSLFIANGSWWLSTARWTRADGIHVLAVPEPGQGGVATPKGRSVRAKAPASAISRLGVDPATAKHAIEASWTMAIGEVLFALTEAFAPFVSPATARPSRSGRHFANHVRAEHLSSYSNEVLRCLGMDGADGLPALLWEQPDEAMARLAGRVKP